MSLATDSPTPLPSFKEAFRFWLKLGFISFGGPAGQIAIMHEEVVERRRWISEERFLHALNFCMLLPGPEAQQLATYIGWLLHGRRGGLVAGGLFVLPSAILLWALSYAYVSYGHLPIAAGLLSGLKLAVLAIVAAAAVRIGRKVMRNALLIFVAVASCALIARQVPYPFLILGAGLLGYLGARWRPDWFAESPQTNPNREPSQDAASTHPDTYGESQTKERHGVTSLSSALCTLLVGVFVWGAPLVIAGLWLGWQHTISRIGLFFSKAAVMTFGGAYAILPYVAQEAVDKYGWLTSGQMLDGLGLAETTPGPLIMVLQFVGFVGGWQQSQGVPPLLAATLGAGMTTWVTFVPCFLWIFLGAPYVERLRGNRHLAAALASITAAVVGVIAHLAWKFGRDVLHPSHANLDWIGLALTLIGFVGLVRWKWNVIAVVLAGAACGLIRHTLGV
jgi:chromate transporter